MVLAAAAVERAMKRQEVIMRALSGTLTWLQAADMLGVEPRSVRRWRARFEANAMSVRLVMPIFPCNRSGRCPQQESQNMKKRR